MTDDDIERRFGALREATHVPAFDAMCAKPARRGAARSWAFATAAGVAAIALAVLVWPHQRAVQTTPPIARDVPEIAASPGEVPFL